MVLNKVMETKYFNLLPIGKLIVREEHTYVHLAADYIQALKYLDLFSHALIFCKPNEKCDIQGCRNNLNQNVDKINSITSFTAKILNIDKKAGMIELDRVYFKKDAMIYDIKPYFPCEDRVEKFKVPDFMKQWPNWRQDQVKSNKKMALDIKSPLDLDHDKSCSIEQIGNIRKEEGEFFLNFNSDKVDIHVFSQFSHIKIFWWFDRFDKAQYRKITQCNPPYENAPKTGIFATRSPVRPNPIAITTASILDIDIDKKQIKVSGLDTFDNTPMVNVVPYIPLYDRVKEFYVPHWLEHWPEWLEERKLEDDLHDMEIVKADVNRIKAYISERDSNIASTENVFQDKTTLEDYSYDEIIIKGARQNNLDNVDLSIPKNKITVITGVSGSGKSSLAFETIYAESQRRFLDSMSTTSRSVFEQLEKPDVDQITGLSPAIAIEQKSIGRNRRSTLGTYTGLYDYLKLLFSKIGTRHCPECGRAVNPLHPEEITRILSLLLPKSELKIQAYNSDNIVKRFVVPEEKNNDFVKALKNYVRLGLEKGKGAITVTLNENQEFFFSSKNMCYHCNRVFFDLTSSTFSFNNPESMCPICKGLGVKLEVEEGLIVPNPNLSILDEASPWWGNLRKHRKKPNANWMRGEILALAEEMNVDLELPWNQLPQEFKHQALYGSNDRKVTFVYENSNGRKGEIIRPVEGAYNVITRLFKENNGDSANRIVKDFMREKECNGCHGERLNAEGRMVTMAGMRFPQTASMTIEELKGWVNGLPKQLSKEQYKIAYQILKDIYHSLDNLIKVGVQYLALDRAIPTLSNGEAQRLRLANQLDSGLTNLLYILDEPSMGLHAKDYKYIIKTLKQLRDKGNTVIVVEHNRDIMLEADRIIDIGPGAGINGGKVIAEGTPKDILNYPDSETGMYLKHVKQVGLKINRRNTPIGWIKLIGAKENNLKNIDVNFPLGIMTCITGVSGSGKSSLIAKTLYPALSRLLDNVEEMQGDHDKIEGAENIDHVINVSQQPIGRTPRSNPATYTGVFEDIRKRFAKTKASKERGYKQNRFSFNSKEGQCEACKGEGRKCVQMHFMPDVWVECLNCNGKRFNAETLEIKYNEKTIADVLDMNVEEALSFFSDDEKIKRVLQTLFDVGLGYIKLGQSALTLSGGEAQRIKLAKELSKTDTGKTLYILDEPTTGLHFADVQNLLDILNRITEAGNTVLVIEHNVDIIKNSDWIIDIGPEGGEQGGRIVAQGTPDDVADTSGSYTGEVLKASK